METTPNLNMRLLEVGQAQKDVTVNEALCRIDALQAGVISLRIATPPTSPSDGNAYIVAASATGAWSGKDGQIAYYLNGWKFIPAKTGMFVWVNDDALYYRYDGTQWRSDYAVQRRNALINASFDIWQRGTSFTTQGYCADRWASTVSGGPTLSITRENYTDLAPLGVHTPEFFLRIACSGGTTGDVFLGQKIEDVRTFAGQTVTISFWAKAASAGQLLEQVRLRQDFGTGGSAGINHVVASNISLTTSWQRYSFGFALPSVAGKTLGTGHNLWVVLYPRRGTTNSMTLDITDVQLEVGSSASALEYRTPMAELALCQRYFCKTLPLATTPAHGAGLAGALTSTASGTGYGDCSTQHVAVSRAHARHAHHCDVQPQQRRRFWLAQYDCQHRSGGARFHQLPQRAQRHLLQQRHGHNQPAICAARHRQRRTLERNSHVPHPHHSHPQ